MRCRLPLFCQLRSLTLKLPLDELPATGAWLGSVTTLTTYTLGDRRLDGVQPGGQ